MWLAEKFTAECEGNDVGAEQARKSSWSSRLSFSQEPSVKKVVQVQAEQCAWVKKMRKS